MSQINVCRLCLNIRNDCKRLYCESGQTNEIYDIAVKYFHPMFLSVDQENKNTVICIECWRHISDFHSYQQSVLQAQGKLLEEESQMEFQSIQPSSSSEIASCHNPIKKQEDEGLIKKEDDEDSISLPDLELMENYSYGDIQQNDENDDPSSKTSYNSDYSDNIDTIHCGVDSINHEEIDIPGTASKLIKGHSVDGIFEDNENMNSDGSHMMKTMKRKRVNRKSQYALDNCISQWRSHLECAVCGALLTSFGLLQHHFRQEHATQQCHISCCNRKFNTRARIEEHARSHTDPNAFKCHNCGSKLGSEATLYTHKRKCLTSLEYCDPLRKPQRTKKSYTKTPLEEIDNFIALYKPILECEICHESCSRFTLLRVHFLKKHPGEECYVTCCQRKFIRRSAFKEHIWLHMDPNAFKCRICDRHQSTHKTLQTHMERVHSQPQSNIHLKDVTICPENKSSESICLNENTNLQRLSLACSTIGGTIQKEDSNIPVEFNPQRSPEINQSTKKHYNEFDEILSAWKPNLDCVVCGECCRTYTKLLDHFRMKHPQNDCYFLCCQQELKSRPAIEEHMRIHRDPNVYKCHFCSTSCKSRQTLREHMQLQHPDLKVHK